MRVQILPYNPSWVLHFQSIKAVLDNALEGKEYQDIVHVGSTSVPGMFAKPVIDIDIIVDSDSSVMPVADALCEKAGYTYRGELNVPGRHAVNANRESTLPNHNLYITVDDCVSLRNHLAIKSVLLEDEDLRKEYSAVKLKLAEEEHDHIGIYVEGKSEILLKILKQSGRLTVEELAQIEEVNRVGAVAPPPASLARWQNQT